MGKSGENISADEDTKPAERHPFLSPDFDERLKVARKQREKVLAERAAATDEAPSPAVTTHKQVAWHTHALQEVTQIETHPEQVPVTPVPGLYRHPKAAAADVPKEPRSGRQLLPWLAGGALAGVLLGSVSTVMVLEGRWTEYEADIVSRAVSQPDVFWPAPPISTAKHVSMTPDRMLGPAVPQTDIAIEKSTANAVIPRPPPVKSSPKMMVLSSPSAAPLVQSDVPDLAANPSASNGDTSVFSVAEARDTFRAEPSRQPQTIASDGMPSVDLGSLAPTPATWDTVMTVPRQDQLQQVSPPLLEWPKRVTHQPALQGPEPGDGFNCQDCQMTALPARDQTVILFMSDTSSVEQKNTMMSRLFSLGLAHVEPHQIRLGASETNVRYFHASDAAAARAVAQSADARLVDLSALRPLPPVGTIELRLGPDRSDIANSNQISSDIKG